MRGMAMATFAGAKSRVRGSSLRVRQVMGSVFVRRKTAKVRARTMRGAAQQMQTCVWQGAVKGARTCAIS